MVPSEAAFRANLLSLLLNLMHLTPENLSSGIKAALSRIAVK
jgi:hypothetical protein